ncbi:hypothetical protein JRO89_XS09G0137400 [Xanthoceras sorbifolium]|uniref:X8 domain-containing protein n=1 Tax=Xanthoceras sorbifolium TaxID=99658 RepID=A0ABQ8HLH7_9ROSI|nr:hypothetical protein JRO89_XS09G0137400 [Xanthoceras sorbifolium]
MNSNSIAGEMDTLPNEVMMLALILLRYGRRSYVGEMDTLPNEKTWCVAKGGTSGDVLQSNLDFACSQDKVDCEPIQSSAPCILPDDVINHDSYTMNSYFHNYGKTYESCNFRGSVSL